MNTPDILIEEFDYPLPNEKIARHPLAQRDSCKLLVSNRDGSIEEYLFCDLPKLLPHDSLLVCNNTKVINARLRFRKGVGQDGALIEIFCLEPSNGADYATTFASSGSVRWECFVGNSKRWKQGALTRNFTLEDGRKVALTAARLETNGNVSTVEFSWSVADTDEQPTFSEIIEAAGEIPIPPYLNRATEESDSADYQTVFGHIEGSVAAPTAGLHFTDNLLDHLKSEGIERREITLHVGAGTFQPVKSDSIADHDMHSEFIAVSRELIKELSTTNKRITAVGTTSVRTLESLYHLGCRAATGLPVDELPQWYPYDPSHPGLTVTESMEALLKLLDDRGKDTFIASTRLMIAPGYKYRIVDQIITNFHQPRSTLLLLVSAFKNGAWRPIYDYALNHDFRFLSYGDACLLR